jgi:hypothetical protein
MLKLGLSALLAAWIAAVPALAQEAQPAGTILWAIGKVERIGADGTVQRLAKGDPVFEGDTLRTAAGSQAQLVMSDEALIAVRAESSVKLSRYSYQGREDGTERAMIELLKGGLRSITGAIGRSNKDNYELKNDMHVIGIRGTDHETFVDATGTFNRVTLGGTYLQSSGERVELAPGETGFASRQAGAAPALLERTPEFMHLAALNGSESGPNLRGFSSGDAYRLQGGLSTPGSGPMGVGAGGGLSLPGLGVGAYGRGGRCEGPCADFVRNNSRGGNK